MVNFEDDRHLDVLQNIESVVVDVYRSDRELLDSEVDQALGAVIVALNAKRLEKPFDPESVKMSKRAKRLFQAVLDVAEWRITGGPLAGEAIGPVPRGVEELVACLRRIRKSVRQWTKERGRRGYLNFVKEYLP